MTTVRTAAAAISRMPARVQDAVSRCLADGGTWRDVASLCAAEGYPNVNAQNVTNYRKGAHKDWLARQERLVAARDRYAWKVDLLKKYTEEGGPAEAGLAAAGRADAGRAAAMDMLEGALDGLDVSDIQTMIADKPGKMLDIIKLMMSLRREMADIRRENREAAAAEAASQKKAQSGNGLTEEQIAAIENAMNLI